MVHYECIITCLFGGTTGVQAYADYIDIRSQDVGWVEHSDTQRSEMRWVSLRSTHPTRLRSG